MAAQRTRSPGTPTTESSDRDSGVAERPSFRAKTPLPESRERPTTSRLDAREVGTVAPDLVERTPDLVERTSGSWDLSREFPTEPAGPPSERDSLGAEATQSVGYYSLRPTLTDAVRIPRAPKVPELDLDPIDEAPAPPRRYSSRPAATTFSQAPETLRTPPPSGYPSPQARRDTIPSSVPPGGRAPSSHPPAVVSRPTSTLPSTPPAPMQQAPDVDDTNRDRSDRRSSYPSLRAPRVYFAPHVRAQANQWAETGSLSLPGASSPRHARALQRALLLALLHEPGWFGIPVGLRQRAGWLFCDGWESGAGAAHPFREIDDLAMVLGLPVSADTRRMLSLAIAGVMPDDFSSRPPPSSKPGGSRPPPKP